MKKIPLTQGKFAIVDDKDYEYLNQWKWCLSNGYAIRGTSKTVNGVRKHKTFFMHRIINDTPPELLTDHVNGNTLDNRRKNLRNATYLENQLNKKSWRNSTSKYKGVWKRKDNNKWQSVIRIRGKRKSLGCFLSEKEAAKAYDTACKKAHGQFAKLNGVTR